MRPHFRGHNADHTGGATVPGQQSQMQSMTGGHTSAVSGAANAASAPGPAATTAGVKEQR